VRVTRAGPARGRLLLHRQPRCRAGL